MISITHVLLVAVAMATSIVQSDSLNGTSYRTDILDPTVYDQPLDNSSESRLRRIPKPTSSDHFYGNKDADVVLVEYVDLECPFCQRQRPNMKKIVEHYDGKVAWVMRHYPLAFHKYAKDEAEASECAAELGGNDVFWKYTDSIFQQSKAGGTGLAPNKLNSIASQHGLNVEDFKKCMESDRHIKKIEQQMEIGTKAGISGTPAIVIITSDGRRGSIHGARPLQEMKNMIDPFVGRGIMDLEDPENSKVL